MDNNPENCLTPNPSPEERGASTQAGFENKLQSEPGYKTVNSSISKQLTLQARVNRQEPTESESLLWQALRNRKLGEKFRRQHPIGIYIPDFVCLEKRLIIEIDGGYHFTPEQKELDEERTLALEQKHLFKVIRFTNEDIKQDINTVLTTIKTILHERQSYKSN
jgi:very-short-patch-repair endonuclease